MFDRLNGAVPSLDAAGSDVVRVETVRVTLGGTDRFFSEFVFESFIVDVLSFVRGLEKTREDRVRVRFGVADSSTVTTWEECRNVGLCSLETASPERVTDWVLVFRRHVGYLM